jgi:hypothetical protein
MIRNRGSRYLQMALALAITGGALGAARANSVNRPFRYNNVASGQQLTFVDLSVSTAAGHYGAFDVFNSPNGNGSVKYVDLGLYGGGATGCFEYTFAPQPGGSPTDITLWVNTASASSPAWSKVSDDADGVFPKFRVWLGANWLDTINNALRLSPWSTGGNSGQFYVKMTQLPYSQATCEGTGAVVRLDTSVTVVRTSN